MNTIDECSITESNPYSHTHLPHFKCYKISSQLVMPQSRSRKIRQIHNLHHQTRPSGEMLGTLTLACLGIVLLPGKTCIFPLPENILNEILA